MINVTVYIGDGYVKKNGEASVYLVSYVNRQKVRFNTGISILPEHWDPERNRIRSSHPQAKDYNLVISTSVSRVNDIFVRYRLQNIPLTAGILRKEFDNPSAFSGVFIFFRQCVKEREGEITASTAKQHYAMISKLEEFKKDLIFSEIDTDFLKKFNRWLITEKKNKQNTRHNTMKSLKAYLNIAIDKKVIRTNPLKKMPVARVRTDPGWLTEEELNHLVKLYNKRSLPYQHQIVLRHYLFSCFTGLRISDIKRLAMEDIINDTIVIIPYKKQNTQPKKVSIPLCRFARLLIKEEYPYRLSGTIFEMYSEYRTRVFLKEIAAHAGIKRNVTFHSGRHTFATLFLRRTKNLLALQKLLGHENIQQTMIYAHILSGEIEEEMRTAFGEY